MRVRWIATSLAVATAVAVLPAAAPAARTAGACKGCGRADLSGGAEAGARSILRRVGPPFGVRGDGNALQRLRIERTPAGTAVRFAQTVDGIPVRDAQVVVNLAGNGAVTSMSSGAHPGLDLPTTTPAVSQARAARIARARVPGGELRAPLRAELVAEPRAGGRAVLAWDVTVATARPWHDWRVLLSAATGAVLDVADRLWRVDGTANVYDPNPVQQSGVGSLTDGSAGLDAYRVTRTLTELGPGPTLSGAFADLTSPLGDCSLPYTPGAASSDTHTYDYTRGDARFAEANVYYAMTRTAALYHALGFPNVMNHPVKADVQCIDADNSSYSTLDKALRFGVGGVDDAEDADIVIHEYGHATQDDQVPGFGAGREQDAMGEGFGDLLAVMMSIDLGNPAWQGAGDAGNRFCVGEWDATGYPDAAEAGCLRWTDGRGDGSPGGIGNYDGIPDLVHDDGRYWSAAMTCVFRGLESAPGATTIGARNDLLRLVLDHHTRLVPTEGRAFQDSANALAASDAVLFGGAHRALIKGCLEQRLSVTVDATPPDVGSTVTPATPEGANGWYRRAVAVNWSATDPESRVQTTGCENQFVTQDTPGIQFVCSATSGGGTTIRSVVVRRDTVPPALAPKLQPADPVLGEPVSVTPHASDSTSGVASQDCDTATTSKLGEHRITCTATDASGLTTSRDVDYVVRPRGRVVPRVRLSRPRLDLDGTMRVVVKAVTNATVTLRASYPGGVQLASKAIMLRAGKSRNVKLTGTKVSRRTLRAALRRRARTVQLTLRLEAPSGDITTRQVKVKVPRRR